MCVFNIDALVVEGWLTRLLASGGTGCILRHNLISGRISVRIVHKEA